MFLFLGGIIVIIGTLWLLENFEILPNAISNAFWPLLLIFLGICIILIPQKVRSIVKSFWFKK